MPGPSSQAIFLSYAREDTDAARRIAEALSGQGIEVWFDQSELRGGDAWDTKIRRQLKECALFVPIISANTQARREGYFRAEWRQADQRTHLMGREKAFIVPVCIDTTSEDEADVPDSFLAVQWTRLPAGQAPDGFAQRLQALLAGESIAGPSAPRRLPPIRPSSPLPPAPGAMSRRPLWKWLTPVLLAAAAAATLLLWHHRSAALSPPSDNLPPEAALDIAKTRQLLTNVNYGREDLALAEGFMAKATDAAPDSSQAWGLRGLIQSTYILRTWDIGKNRQSSAQSFCEKALALDHSNPEAMLGIAYVYAQTGAYADEIALMRKAIRLAPDDPRYRRAVGTATFNGGQHAEGISLLKDTVQRFPMDPVSWYDLGLCQWYDHQYAEALASYRHLVTLAPMAGAYIAIAELLCLRGDLAGADAAIANIPVEARSGDRAVAVDMWLGILERKPSRVLAAEARTSVDYFTDAQFREPKSFVTALAFRIAGKENLAAREWDQSIAILERRLKDNPNDQDVINLAIALAYRGRLDEAARTIGALEAEQREMDLPAYPLALAHYHAARGDAPQAIAYLNKLPHGELFNARIDPWWDPIRDTPAFQAFLSSKTHLQYDWQSAH